MLFADIWNGNIFNRIFNVSKSFSIILLLRPLNFVWIKESRVHMCENVCICFRISNFHVKISWARVKFLDLGKDIQYDELDSWVRVSGVFAVKYANFSVSLFKKCGPFGQSAERAVLSMAKITKILKYHVRRTLQHLRMWSHQHGFYQQGGKR